jgi:acetyl-CoA carboxylase carboxyltransferase component
MTCARRSPRPARAEVKPRAQETPGRGKLLPRVRVQMLLDPGTPFLEIAPLAALHMYKDKNGQDEAPAPAWWPASGACRAWTA